MAEKSFVTMESAISLSFGAILISLVCLFSLKLSEQKIYSQGKKFVLVGMGEMKEQDKIIFVPIYKEAK